MKQNDRLNMRLPKEVAAWLRRSAAKQKTTPSEIARRVFHAAYEKRHAK